MSNPRKVHKSKWHSIEIPSKGITYPLTERGNLAFQPQRHKRRTYPFFDFGTISQLNASDRNFEQPRSSPNREKESPTGKSALTSNWEDTTYSNNTNTATSEKNSQTLSVKSSDFQNSDLISQKPPLQSSSLALQEHLNPIIGSSSSSLKELFFESIESIYSFPFNPFTEDY